MLTLSVEPGFRNNSLFSNFYANKHTALPSPQQVKLHPSEDHASVNHSFSRLNPAASSSSDQTGTASTALKATFYVKKNCFRFKDASSFTAKNYAVNAQTVFFPICFPDLDPNFQELRSLINIPVDLINTALKSDSKTVQFKWHECHVELQFIESTKGLKMADLLSLIDQIGTGKLIGTREIFPEDVEHLINNTYLPS